MHQQVLVQGFFMYLKTEYDVAAMFIVELSCQHSNGDSVCTWFGVAKVSTAASFAFLLPFHRLRPSTSE